MTRRRGTGGVPPGVRRSKRGLCTEGGTARPRGAAPCPAPWPQGLRAPQRHKAAPCCSPPPPPPEGCPEPSHSVSGPQAGPSPTARPKYLPQSLSPNPNQPPSVTSGCRLSSDRRWPGAVPGLPVMRGSRVISPPPTRTPPPFANYNSYKRPPPPSSGVRIPARTTAEVGRQGLPSRPLECVQEPVQCEVSPPQYKASETHCEVPPALYKVSYRGTKCPDRKPHPKAQCPPHGMTGDMMRVPPKAAANHNKPQPRCPAVLCTGRWCRWRRGWDRSPREVQAVRQKSVARVPAQPIGLMHRGSAAAARRIIGPRPICCRSSMGTLFTSDGPQALHYRPLRAPKHGTVEGAEVPR